MHRSNLLFLVLLSLPTTALAEGKKIVFREATVVEEEVQRPEIAVFISRQNLNEAYELELKESFLPKILATIEKEPFQ